MKRRVAISAAALATLACAACTPPRPHAHNDQLQRISALDCPAEEGDLELKSGGSGQPRCVYGTDSGDQVMLQLISLDAGGEQAALQPIERQLKTEVPVAETPAAGPASPPPRSADRDADWQSGDDHDRVDLDLPGLHIHSHGGGRADVDAAGVQIHAQDHQGGRGGTAEVNVGDGVHIDAHDGAAQIRITEKGSGIRLSYILAADTPGPHGYRVGAYEARGPAGGPLVVAEILGKDKESDDLRHDARHLLKLNVGG